MNLPTEFFEYKENELHCEKTALKMLVKKYGTPLYVYSKQAFTERFLELDQGLKSLPHLICFAVKANSNLSVLNLLKNLGAGADVVSGGEMTRALKAGISPNKIVFSGVGKTADEIELGIQKKIFSFNVESTEELALIEKISKKKKTKTSVALRFNPDINAKTHPYISTGLKENKFGLQKAEILKILRNTKNSSQIRISGLSIHIGSQISELAPLKEAFIALKSLAKTAEGLGIKLDFLDLGGGLGVTYHQEAPPSPEKYTKLIVELFQNTSYRIILEPGRSLSANAGVLVTEVLYRKASKKSDFLIVDAGMNDLMRPALYEASHAILPVFRSKKSSVTHKTNLVGPVCESSDTFARGIELPKSLKNGDFLAILSAGAYGMSMSSNYNTRPRPAEVLVSGKKIKLIRPREKISELLSYDTLS